MKRLILRHQDIEGMSRIGFLNKQGNPKERSTFELYVYTDDGGDIPHMHIHIEDENDACIRYDSPKYFNHGKNNNTVSTDVAEMIDSLLRKPYNSKITYWDYAVASWNANNSSTDLPEDIEQPNYSLLNKEM